MDEQLMIDLVRQYYEQKGYPHVCCGLQFGVHLVLYADHPSRVHSDYAVYVANTPLDARVLQTLVRSMLDLHKSLILVQIQAKHENNAIPTTDKSLLEHYEFIELAVTTEHAPFRQVKHPTQEVGRQQKKVKESTGP
jgi:hypothetical protein